MAFNLANLFGTAAQNLLLNPNAAAGAGFQNQLAPLPVHAPLQNYPIAGANALANPTAAPANIPVPMPRPDPSTVSSIPAPAAQPAPTQVAGGGGMPSFFNSDRKAALNDFFLGLAAGQSPSQSLALGAANVAANKKTRADQNATVDWLTSKGVDATQASFLAKNPAALQDYLKSTFQKPQQLENVGKGAALYDPATKQWITPPEGIGSSATEYGLAPVYGKDANGNTVIGQLAKDGSFHQTSLPNGFTPTPGYNNLDTGTAIIPQDKKTGALGQPIQKDVAGKSAQEASGKAAGEAQASIPGAEGTAQQILDNITSLQSDPYLPNMVGPVAGRMPNLSADSQRVQGKMDQIKGQTFLQAYQTLRGGGAITEVEGAKATDAMARLNTAQNINDYNAALNDLKTVISNGVQRLRQRANPNGQISPDNPNVDDLVKKYGGS